MPPRSLCLAARTLAVLALLSVGAGARGETAAVVFADPSGFNEAAQLKLLRATEAVLRERSGWVVQEQARPTLGGPRRRCEEDPTCAQALASATGASHVLLLSLGASAAGLAVAGVLVDVGERRAAQRKVKGVSLDAPQASLRELVDGLLPGYARKGWGGLQVDAAPGSRIKVDGRVVATAPLKEALPVVAGGHEVDVLFPSGQALLQHVAIPEGGRVPLSLEAGRGQLVGPTGPAPGLSGVRGVAYTAWSAGALTLASSLVLAGLNQKGITHAHPVLIDALVGAGAGLGGAGAGLFLFDLSGR